MQCNKREVIRRIGFDKKKVEIFRYICIRITATDQANESVLSFGELIRLVLLVLIVHDNFCCDRQYFTDAYLK